ncbi:acyl-CoA dehydrogenase family protein [Caulobacter endophyticus]|uniref:acyl-CoA dehydrogenase family protein n=1 Tax=Caulobacter endophyticus TaxID=2172652 RepID=UPI00240F6FF3|nr:acyl-CoA dehydrogenase family protein [Caulobacter endophyticus]MDG2527348.1 acyl-CoA/acyl-ACP dehydrogenase [Caulobacter endophyticus]
MSEISEADERAILDAIDKWLEKKVAPVAMQLEHDDEYPHALVEDMKELGLFGALIDPEYGGLGLSALTYSRIVTKISAEWMSLTGVFNSHLMMAMVVQKFGTQKQKDFWLPRFASGELRGCLGLTEPDAGTDLQGIRTVARRDGGDYVVNGAKTWITNAIEGHVSALLVKTDPEAQPRHKGMSMLITPKIDPVTRAPIPGVSNGRKLEKLGYKGIDSGEFIFEDYRCDAELCLVGGEEGQGFLMATGGLEIGRINVAARSVGIAKRALAESVKYAQVRKTMGKPIAQHQAIQLKLGEMGAKTRASELLVEDAAKAYDRGERVDMEAGMAKYYASETALYVATEAMRIHGAYGYSKEYPIERLFRDAPLMCIGEGTNEMQRIIIARQLVARNPV